MTINTIRPGVSAALLITLLGACGSADSTPAGSTPSTTASTTATTVRDDCGRDVSVPSPPRRAVALEQGATEVMLSLGLGDRMVGTSYLTDPVLPELAAQYAEVPVLAQHYPSPEQFRSAEPDFAYSMLSSAFTPEVAGTRAELAGLGVPAYVTRLQCEDPAASADFSFDEFYQEVDDIADVFGVPERAEALVADQRSQLRQAEQRAAAVKDDGLSVAWFYSTYDGAPIVAGAGGVPDAIGGLLGLHNVFQDVDEKWTEVSWEEIAARDPDVIVLADLTRGRPGDSAADKRGILAADPVTSRLSAVTGRRLIDVPGSALDASVRSAGAVGTVATAIERLSPSRPSTPTGASS